MDRHQIRLSQAIEGFFIDAHARRLAPGTLTDYNNTLTKFEAFLGDDPPLAIIAADQIRAFLNSLDGLTPKTVLNHHVGLSALWTWALRESLLDRHVVRDVQPPRPDRREVAPYTEADIKALLTACARTQPYRRPGKTASAHTLPTALRNRAIIVLLVDTGIRASELCDLQLQHVDLTNHRISVMGKGRKERVLPICPRTAQVLWRHLATRDEKRSTAFLFTTRQGRRMNRHNLRKTLQAAGNRAGVTGVTVHRFRHTFAIQFLRNGGTVFALQRMLGHASLEMVQRYLAIAEADVERAHQEASPVVNWML